MDDFFFILILSEEEECSAHPEKKKPELAFESKNFNIKINTQTMLAFKLCNYNIGPLILNDFILADQTPVVPSVFSKVCKINFNDDLKCVSYNFNPLIFL